MTSNPFATRFIRPGAIDFLFPAGQSAASLVQQLRDQNWSGQIIGPHGSGKSTLLAALLPAIHAAGRKIVCGRVQGSGFRRQGPGIRGQEDLPPATHDSPLTTHRFDHFDIERIAEISLNADTQIIIDGFEQLPWLARRKVKDRCRRQGAGLLATAHRDSGLPTLYHTQPTLDVAHAVVHRLLPPGDTTITADDIARAFEASEHNLRETLFALYDVYRLRN